MWDFLVREFKPRQKALELIEQFFFCRISLWVLASGRFCEFWGICTSVLKRREKRLFSSVGRNLCVYGCNFVSSNLGRAFKFSSFFCVKM